MLSREGESDDTVIRSRQRNEWIQEMSDDFQLGDGLSTYICECGDVECRDIVRLTPVEYERIRSVGTRFVIHTNHENPEIDMVTEENPRWAILEKLPGDSAQAAERSNPRRLSGGPR